MALSIMGMRDQVEQGRQPALRRRASTPARGPPPGHAGYHGTEARSATIGLSFAPMPSELSDLLRLWDRSDVLDAIVAGGAAGLPDVARPATVAGLARQVSPLLVVLPRSRDAEAFAAALGPWMAGGRVELFPAWEVLPGEAMSPTLDTMGRRLRILRELAGGRAETLPSRPP